MKTGCGEIERPVLWISHCSDVHGRLMSVLRVVDHKGTPNPNPSPTRTFFVSSALHATSKLHLLNRSYRPAFASLDSMLHAIVFRLEKMFAVYDVFGY